MTLMDEERPLAGGLLKEMAAFVVELRHRIAQAPQKPYPVLGAEGDTFVIEIASGSLREREILSNLIFEIKGGPQSLPAEIGRTRRHP